MLKKLMAIVLVFFIVFKLVGCGTILYPERKGQMNGKIDPTVMLLDAVGLLFFLVPGIIAFAIDFSNGSIYLPGGGQSQLSKKELLSLKDKAGKVDLQKVNQLLTQKTQIDYQVQQRAVYYPLS